MEILYVAWISTVLIRRFCYPESERQWYDYAAVLVIVTCLVLMVLGVISLF